MLRGDRWYSAHREHAYQRAVRNGHSHAVVSATVVCINCLLGGLAWFGVRDHTRLLIVALAGFLVVLALYVHVERALPMQTDEAVRKG